MKIYLACPYSHPYPAIRKHRFEVANKTAANLIKAGHIVFSPISHSHPIAEYIGNAMDRDFWLKQDEAFIDWCDEVWVIHTDGWTESEGIKHEVRYAFEKQKRVRIICNGGDAGFYCNAAGERQPPANQEKP